MVYNIKLYNDETSKTSTGSVSNKQQLKKNNNEAGFNSEDLDIDFLINKQIITQTTSVIENSSQTSSSNILNSIQTSTHVIANSVTNVGSSSSSSVSSEFNREFEQTYKSSRTRIGDEFQVNLSDYDVRKPNVKELKEKETLIWKPCSDLGDNDIENYLFVACSKHSYNIEQALAILCWNKHDLGKSLISMKSYVPKPNEWTDEDKILFEQAFNFHGKNFNKIKQVLPDKSQASLVNYYYMWKKSRQHTSLIDHQQLNNKNLNINQASSNGQDWSSGCDLVDLDFNNLNSNEKDYLSNANQKEDNDDEENINRICCNCDSITTDLQSTPKGMLCSPCYAYWKYTGGLMRPDNLTTFNFSNGMLNPNSQRLFNSNTSNNSQQPYSSNHSHHHLYHHQQYLHHNKSGKHISQSEMSSVYSNDMRLNNVSKEAKNFHKSLRRPPKGIYLNYEELVNLAEIDYNQIFEMLNKKMLSLRKEVQSNKQYIATLINQLSTEADLKIAIDNALLQIEANAILTPSWSSHEISLALQGFIKYQTDFLAISQVIGSKNENSIKLLYNYFKENLNLEKSGINNLKDLKIKSLMLLNDLNDTEQKDQLHIKNTNQNKNKIDISGRTSLVFDNNEKN